MKYMLISCCEREIGVPEFFVTHEEAFDAMCRYVSDTVGASVASVKETYLNGEEYDEETCVLENSAWTQSFHNNYDWKIFNLEGFWVS